MKLRGGDTKAEKVVFTAKVREEVGESVKGSSSSYSSECPLLNDGPDLRRHASLSRLKNAAS